MSFLEWGNSLGDNMGQWGGAFSQPIANTGFGQTNPYQQAQNDQNSFMDVRGLTGKFYGTPLYQQTGFQAQFSPEVQSLFDKRDAYNAMSPTEQLTARTTGNGYFTNADSAKLFDLGYNQPIKNMQPQLREWNTGYQNALANARLSLDTGNQADWGKQVAAEHLAGKTASSNPFGTNFVPAVGNQFANTINSMSHRQDVDQNLLTQAMGLDAFMDKANPFGNWKNQGLNYKSNFGNGGFADFDFSNTKPGQQWGDGSGAPAKFSEYGKQWGDGTGYALAGQGFNWTAGTPYKNNSLWYTGGNGVKDDNPFTPQFPNLAYLPPTSTIPKSNTLPFAPSTVAGVPKNVTNADQAFGYGLINAGLQPPQIPKGDYRLTPPPPTVAKNFDNSHLYAPPNQQETTKFSWGARPQGWPSGSEQTIANMPNYRAEGGDMKTGVVDPRVQQVLGNLNNRDTADSIEYHYGYRPEEGDADYARTQPGYAEALSDKFRDVLRTHPWLESRLTRSLAQTLVTALENNENIDANPAFAKDPKAALKTDPAWQQLQNLKNDPLYQQLQQQTKQNHGKPVVTQPGYNTLPDKDLNLSFIEPQQAFAFALKQAQPKGISLAWPEARNDRPEMESFDQAISRWKNAAQTMGILSQPKPQQGITLGFETSNRPIPANLEWQQFQHRLQSANDILFAPQPQHGISLAFAPGDRPVDESYAFNHNMGKLAAMMGFAPSTQAPMQPIPRPSVPVTMASVPGMNVMANDIFNADFAPSATPPGFLPWYTMKTNPFDAGQFQALQHFVDVGGNVFRPGDTRLFD